jgi:hypothetical protein
MEETPEYNPFLSISFTRRIVMGGLGIVYFSLTVAAVVLNESWPSMFLLFTGLLIGMWLLQWMVLAGEPRPDQPASLLLVGLMALGFGGVGAVLVMTWNFLSLYFVFGMPMEGADEWSGATGGLGFVFCALIVILVGQRLPRYPFLLLVLGANLVGCGCQVLLLFVDFDQVVSIEFFNIFQEYGLMGLFAGFLTLWWGISPIAYLIVYRNYKMRLSAAASPADVA